MANRPPPHICPHCFEQVDLANHVCPAVDELVIENTPFEGWPGLTPGVGLNKIIFGVGGVKQNLVGREKLLEEINKRMAATNNTMVWKLKYALDKAEFARTHVLTEDLSRVEKFLRDAARLTRVTIADLERDADGYRTLADLAKQIKDLETED